MYFTRASYRLIDNRFIGLSRWLVFDAENRLIWITKPSDKTLTYLEAKTYIKQLEFEGLSKQVKITCTKILTFALFHTTVKCMKTQQKEALINQVKQRFKLMGCNTKKLRRLSCLRQVL